MTSTKPTSGVEYFRRRLADARKSRPGESQETLAESLEISKQTISKYEQGLTCPNLKIFVSICENFDISPNEFLGWKGSGVDLDKKQYPEILMMFENIPQRWQDVVRSILVNAYSERKL